EEGAVRIESGSSFQWFIQDGSAEKVLQEVMFPLFRENKFVAGLELGLEKIMAAGRLKPIPENHRPAVCRRQQ
ncbi:MAG: TPM domain-containing protein, partial [Deltaproteobacteria bacterium]|nr:TPM domain-containing protein [Deltaproteobacteria bacterium]